jgi:Uma2 family endonuclease
MNRILMPLPGTVEDPRYPDSDGRPMGETDFHNLAVTHLRQAIEDQFAGRDEVYVAANVVMYYKLGDPKARRDPDVLVAIGVRGNHPRKSYRFWEEGVVPCTLFEIASKRTWRNDVGEKIALYASLGIKEYFIFDPERRYVKPPLQGYRLSRRRYILIKPRKDGSLASDELGLLMKPEGWMLRLTDRATGNVIPTRAERAERERERADRQTELTEQERQRAEQEKERAEQEKQRADALAAELARLRERLGER